MDCSNCGAPLPAKSNICTYCKTLNEVDLRTLQRSGARGGLGPRKCPRCKIPMRMVSLSAWIDLEIERCERCLGIFFDPGELEAVLEKSVKPVMEVDYNRLERLIEEERKTDHDQVAYAPCPECGKLMNRKAYGHRAGVVVDRCRDHGLWLDGGELGQLVKWARAGGKAHAEAMAGERERLAKREAGAEISILQQRMSQTDRNPIQQESGLAEAIGLLWRILQ